mgnify:CR=1 FL=1
MGILNEMNIRKAKKEDCPRLLELIRELAVFEKAPEKVTVTEAHFIESGFGRNPVWQAFVATVAEDPKKSVLNNKETILPNETISEGTVNKETIVGFALYYIRYSTWKGQMLYLEDLLITEDFRGKGIGKALFERVIEEAKERKLRGMIWQVLEWNTPAIDFYKKYNASLDSEWVNGELLF